MRAPVRRAGAALTGILFVSTACTYYNSLYNAEHLFEDAERHRRAGKDSLAAPLYADVIRKAASGFRSDPEGGWAYEATFLLGRAHLRSGDLQAARAAFRHSGELADTPDERLSALVYVGILEATAGDRATAISLFNEALAGTTVPAARGEGHLHRGLMMLASGHPDGGWWDLDRAAAEHPPLRVEATLERFRWAVILDDLRRAEESVQRLLAYPEAAARADDFLEVLHTAEGQWGAGTIAELLGRVDGSAWERDARDRMALEHARLLRRAGRPDEAERRAFQVADGRGPSAAGARLTLAEWSFAEADDVGDAYALRPLLLPSIDVPEVAELVSAIDEFESLAFAGVDVPLAWFLAGEVARDRLGAPRVARELLLAYANAAPAEPWAPKALLAALQLTEEEESRLDLQARLEAHLRSPYVLAARGRPAVGFEALEEELLSRLTEIRPR